VTPDRWELPLRRGLQQVDAITATYLGEVDAPLWDGSPETAVADLGPAARALSAAIAASGSESDPTADAVHVGVIVTLIALAMRHHVQVAGVDAHTAELGAARAQKTLSILVGDQLLGSASELAAALGTRVAEYVAQTIGELSHGCLSAAQSSALSADGLPPAVAAALTRRASGLGVIVGRDGSGSAAEPLTISP
jgi:hypothetical protein